MDITACVTDENGFSKIEKCLESLSDIKIRTILVGTDIPESIREYAEAHGILHVETEWTGSFSDKLNMGARYSENDLIFVMESDEYLDAGDFGDAVHILNKSPLLVGQVKRINRYFEDGEESASVDWTGRLFHRRMYHFTGRTKAQLVIGSVFDHTADALVQDIGTLKYAKSFFQSDITVVNDERSTDPERKLIDADNRIQLLLEDLKDEPEDPYFLYRIGAEYYRSGRFEQAISFFEQSMDREKRIKLVYVKNMILAYGWALLKSGDQKKALLLEKLYDDFVAISDFHFLMGHIYLHNALLELAVSEFLRATKIKTAKVAGVNSYKAFYNAGLICELSGNVEKAGEYYQLAGEYRPAASRLAFLSREWTK